MGEGKEGRESQITKDRMPRVYGLSRQKARGAWRRHGTILAMDFHPPPSSAPKAPTAVVAVTNHVRMRLTTMHYPNRI